MTTFLVAVITGFIAYSIGFKLGAISTLARLSAISKEMQLILNDLQQQMNQWTEDDL